MRTFERVVGLPGLSNVGVLDRDPAFAVYRGAQPAERGYDSLKCLGVRTVINLRNHSEAAEIHEANMIGMHFPLSVLAIVSTAKISGILAAINDPNNAPVFIHCAQGHDRTGIICAAYRIAHQDWELDEAIEEMQAYGYNDLWVPMMHSLREFAASIGKGKGMACHAPTGIPDGVPVVSPKGGG